MKKLDKGRRLNKICPSFLIFKNFSTKPERMEREREGGKKREEKSVCVKEIREQDRESFCVRET